MDIKVVSPDGKPAELVDVKQPETMVNSQPDDLYQREIGRVLGVENESEFNKYQINLKTLVDFAKTQTTDHSPESLKWVIRSLETKLGTPPFAEDRIKFITRYAYLLSEEKKISEEKKKFERI
jgi:hypothetical protein